MMRIRLVMALMVLLLVPACEMTETQKAAGLGGLGGGLVGALAGKSKDRGRNAMIGAAAGALGGTLYGQHKSKQRLENENQMLRRELETYEMRKEMERLRRENDRLRAGKPKRSPASFRAGDRYAL